ncbi:MAG TPA: hypothetical protein PLN18_02970, partial [Candidatus Colwellbacteria bacterium]|nr:hypothetical protein [Candidatus Colwellbacteria bacterium]
MSKKCLAVPQRAVEALDFWKRLERDDNVIRSAITLSSDEVDDLLATARREGRFLERSGKDGIEQNPEWQQIIFYALVVQKGRFFVYKRSGAVDESRLALKLSAGIGGHIEPYDTDLVDSLPRELDEKLLFTRRIQELPTPDKINIVGLIKDERDQVGQVHLGLVCVVYLKADVSVEIKGDESVEGWMITLDEYERLIASGDYTP